MTLTQHDTTSRAGVRLPKELWEAIRIAAVERGTSANQFCVEALESYLAAENKRKRT